MIKAKEAGRFAIALCCVTLTILLMLISIIAFGQDKEYFIDNGDTIEHYAVHITELIGAGKDHVIYQEIEGSYEFVIYGRKRFIRRLAKDIDIYAEPFEAGYYFHVYYYRNLNLWRLDERNRCNRRKHCIHFDEDQGS